MAFGWGSRIIKRGPAVRVVFFYPGEEGTYVDQPEVTLYENGVVHLRSEQEETTTHLRNCEILWRFDPNAKSSKSPKSTKFKLLRMTPSLHQVSPELSESPESPTPPDNPPPKEI